MSKPSHKFQREMQSGITYERYFRNRCHEMICLAEELEHVLGRKKTLEIMGKARERYIVEITKKGRGPVKSFEDFKAAEKAENASPPLFTHYNFDLSRRDLKQVEAPCY